MEVLVDEPLVMPEVEIGLSPVLGDEHLAVLERVHCAGIDVDVRVELAHRDPEATRLEESAEGGGREPLPERTHHATCHEHELRHALLPAGITQGYPELPEPVPELAAIANSSFACRRAVALFGWPDSILESSTIRSSPLMGRTRATVRPSCLALGHQHLLVGERGDLREMRHDQHLVVTPDRGQRTAHCQSRLASHACVDLVENERRRCRGQDQAGSEHGPRQLPA